MRWVNERRKNKSWQLICNFLQPLTPKPMDPFYSPILNKLDQVFLQLGYSDEPCRERLVCNMYKNPSKYSPHSNYVSAELSRWVQLRPLTLNIFLTLKISIETPLSFNGLFKQIPLSCDSTNMCKQPEMDKISVNVLTCIHVICRQKSNSGS